MDLSQAFLILGVQSNSPWPEIRAAYHSCLLQSHPDTGGEYSNATIQHLLSNTKGSQTDTRHGVQFVIEAFELLKQAKKDGHIATGEVKPKAGASTATRPRYRAAYDSSSVGHEVRYTAQASQPKPYSSAARALPEMVIYAHPGDVWLQVYRAFEEIGTVISDLDEDVLTVQITEGDYAHGLLSAEVVSSDGYNTVLFSLTPLGSNRLGPIENLINDVAEIMKLPLREATQQSA